MDTSSTGGPASEPSGERQQSQSPPPEAEVTASYQPAPKKRLGDYEILRELGHGGMGQVYLARNLISDRLEAMKILLPALAQQPDLPARFMREIKTLATLEHPNIAQLRTAFSADGQLIMIMEYVEGDTLAHRLERGAFPPAEALNYTGQVLIALSYAHGKGIIHRDIKPANMMLTPGGVVKLMDFGIARTAAQDITVTGATVGSLDYMSPEQVMAAPTDARSDLYSVGVSLYEMVTGRRMFSATSSFSIMEAQVKQMPPPPVEVLPSIPKALNDIIMVAIAKNPAERFQTADAFRNALSQVNVAAVAAGAAASQSAVATEPMTTVPVPPTPTPPPQVAQPVVSATPQPQVPAPGGYATPQPQPARGGRHLGWILAGAIVVLVAIFGGTQVYRSHTQNAVVPAMAPAAATQPAPTPANAPPQPAVQPPAPSNSNASAVPATPLPPAPKTRQTSQTENAAPPPAPPVDTSQPSAEQMAEQKKLMDDLENEEDHLDSRAAAVESSLATLEQQMQQSGLGLRGDVVTARSNMRTDLAKAKQALEGADTDRARKYLDQAGHEVDKLEAFLGRR